MTKLEESIPWTRSFIEIALRGLLRLHHDYLLWSLPQVWNKEIDSSVMRTGPGVAFADETTVCAAITQEYLASRIAYGGWISEVDSKGIKEGPRHYRISREAKYPESGERVDIAVERVDPNGTFKYLPVYIEAKRAFLWTTHLGDTEKISTSNQVEEVVKDVLKLRKQAGASANPAYIGYILVWNVTDLDRGTSINPDEYLKSVFKMEGEAIVRQIRAAPLATAISREACDSFCIENAAFSRWLWVALIEVAPTPLYSGRSEAQVVSQ